MRRRAFQPLAGPPHSASGGNHFRACLSHVSCYHGTPPPIGGLIHPPPPVNVFLMVVEAGRTRSRPWRIALPGHLPAVSSRSRREERALWGGSRIRARSPFPRALPARPNPLQRPRLQTPSHRERVSISPKFVGVGVAFTPHTSYIFTDVGRNGPHTKPGTLRGPAWRPHTPGDLKQPPRRV